MTSHPGTAARTNPKWMRCDAFYMPTEVWIFPAFPVVLKSRNKAAIISVVWIRKGPLSLNTHIRFHRNVFRSKDIASSALPARYVDVSLVRGKYQRPKRAHPGRPSYSCELPACTSISLPLRNSGTSSRHVSRLSYWLLKHRVLKNPVIRPFFNQAARRRGAPTGQTRTYYYRWRLCRWRLVPGSPSSHP